MPDQEAPKSESTEKLVEGSGKTEAIRKSVEESDKFVEWVVKVLRGKKLTTKLLLLDVALFTVFNPVVFGKILEAFDTKPPQHYAFYFSLVIGAVFVAAAIAAWRTQPKDKPRRDLAERSAIKGLLPYGKDDATLFTQLQREQDLATCAEAITASDFRFGVLCGESGNGKTSFLQAGLWPKLPEQKHRCVYVKCTELDPIEAIRQAILEQLAPSDKAQFPLSLPEMFEAAARLDSKPLVVILDQLEQFFVHRPRKKDRAPFIAAMEVWFKQQVTLPVKILISLRSDFLDRLIEMQKLLGYSLGPHQSFRLEKFAPAQAAEIFRVIAEQEKLEYDSGFVEKMVADQLASATDGLVSPVDIQVLAWMIAGQKLKEERAFNEKTFRNLGGVEGLLERFLTRALDARETEQRRQAAVKVLLALTDLDRNTRAGVLTKTELEEKLQGHLSPSEIADAIEWLSRGDVRLIAPVKRKNADSKEIEGHELAHERLIPALRRIAGKQLSDADRAEQLLDRRTNEWLGSGRHSRYLFSWAESRLINKHRQLIAWGKERQAKEALLAASQRRFYWRYATAGLVTVLVFIGWIGWNSNAWQTWLIKRDLRSYGSSLNANFALGLIAQAFVYAGDSPQALQVWNRISDDSSVYTLRAIAESIAKLNDKEQASMLLVEVVKTAQSISNNDSKVYALRAIAESYAKLGETMKDSKLLTEAVKTAQSISNGYSKAYALRAIAASYAKLNGKEQASMLLVEAVKTAQSISNNDSKVYALRAIAESYAKLGETMKDSKLLTEAVKTAQSISVDDEKAVALSAIAASYAKLNDTKQAKTLLAEAVKTAERISDASYAPSKAYALKAIAASIAKLNDKEQASMLLAEAAKAAQSMSGEGLLSNYKADALHAIAASYAKLAESSNDRALYAQTFRFIEGLDSDENRDKVLSSILSIKLAAADVGSLRKLTSHFSSEAKKAQALARILIAVSRPELIGKKQGDENDQER